MVFPLYDDNTDRQTTPFVNYGLIALNIFVFVVLQQLGSNDQFTYAFSTVPAEIIRGTDIVTPSRVLEHPITGQRVMVPGLGETPLSVYLTLFTSMFMHGGIAHIAGQHALPLDLWRQHRRSSGPCQVPHFLPAVWGDRVVGPRFYDCGFCH